MLDSVLVLHPHEESVFQYFWCVLVHIPRTDIHVGCLLWSYCSLVLRQDYQLNLESLACFGVAVQQAQGSSCLCLPSAEVFGCVPLCPTFMLALEPSSVPPPVDKHFTEREPYETVLQFHFTDRTIFPVHVLEFFNGDALSDTELGTKN